MSNKISKVRAKCMEAIRSKPGILRSELYSMDIGHRCSIGAQVSNLVYSGRVVKIRDDVMLSDRLYPKGKEPPPFIHEKVYRNSLYSKDKRNQIPKDVHGDKFFRAFDEAFGLLYIDLKILGIAAQEMMRE